MSISGLSTPTVARFFDLFCLSQYIFIILTLETVRASLIILLQSLMTQQSSVSSSFFVIQLKDTAKVMFGM